MIVDARWRRTRRKLILIDTLIQLEQRTYGELGGKINTLASSVLCFSLFLWSDP